MMPTVTRTAERRTERLIEELLQAQGWDLRKPPQGSLFTQQEYKDNPVLRESLAAASKSGHGAGIPEYILVDSVSIEPWAVFEGKSKADQIEKAVEDVCTYGDGFRKQGYSPVLVAVAGTEDERFRLRVLKWKIRDWEDITYEGQPISWIPSKDQLASIRKVPDLFELRPQIPSPEVLMEKAAEINGLLRESGLKDDFRPAAIGAIMLALWKSKGDIRRDREYILSDINEACAKAFRDAEKPILAKSLHVDEANEKLAIRARRISEILERLNITTLTAEHDYLGTLYEEFFRYTGGNTIGQYFTPRHVTRLMTDMCEVTADDVVLDPTCGTGGFLIAAMDRMQRESKLPRSKIVQIVKKQLIGIEEEPVTAALCVANMILRGDGSTGVRRADCFRDDTFPARECDIVLMNPPFPHKKTDTPPEKFIDRGLEALKRRGMAAIVVPSSLLVKSDKAEWRQAVLEQNTLLGVISLPGELFQPYASSTTAILMFEAGVPHARDNRVFFCRIENDGFKLKKGVRVAQPTLELTSALSLYRSGGSSAGFCSWSPLDIESGFAPGAYIKAATMKTEELLAAASEVIRNKSAFAVRFAPQLADMQESIRSEMLTVTPYATGRKRHDVFPNGKGKAIGDFFSIYYGQKALHSKENLASGRSLVISSSGMDNGCYGFFDFPNLIKPPFVTVPSTGSIGEAAVQEFPCGVTDDCLLLIPKDGTPPEALYIAAAILRHESWRFDYGRKMTPGRIGGFPLPLPDEVMKQIHKKMNQAKQIETLSLGAAAGETKQVGRTPERLKIAGNWEGAVKKAFTKKKPAGGWPS